MARFIVTLSNPGGTLDSRVVISDGEGAHGACPLKAAALDILSGVAFMSDGDVLAVTEED